MSTSRSAARALAAALVCGTFAACGSTGTNGVAGKPTGQIVSSAKAAVIAADSVHVQGDLGSGASAIKLDMVLAKGKGASGTVVIGNQHIQLLRVGADVYVKGDAQFYHSVVAGLASPSAQPAPSSPSPGSPATKPGATPGSTPTPGAKPSSAAGAATPGSAAASTPGEITLNAMQVNYLHIVPSEPQYQIFASLTDPASLVDQILTDTGSLSKDGQKDIRGSKTIVLSGSTGNSKVYVGIDGPAYLLRVVPAGGGSLDFLDYGSPVTLAAPPPNQVVDISTIPK